MSICRLLSRLAFVTLLPLLLALFMGCARPPAADVAAEPGSSDEAADMVVPVEADEVEACAGTGIQWVGQQTSTVYCTFSSTDGIHCACPPTVDTRWKSTRLFELHTAAQTSIPPQLAKYCVYEWIGPSGEEGPFPPEIQGGGIAGWSIDGIAVASLVAPAMSSFIAPGYASSAVSAGTAQKVFGDAPVSLSPVAAMRDWLRNSFRDLGRGGLASLPVGETARANVEIAFLDTSPTDLLGDIPLGNSAHGHVVGWTARDLLCDETTSETCFAHISTYLAQPYTATNAVDCVKGGSFGTRVSLARQIYRAVETWKQNSGQHPHLVIPLALGWDEQIEHRNKAGFLAVHDALIHASCQGVFLAAAAGNDTGGPTPATGALYPAAWESEAAPDFATCQSFEGTEEALNASNFVDSAFWEATGNVPLLLSVGGVDRRGAPLTLTRPASLTKLVALAFQADAGAPSPTLPQPLTGTSIGVTVAGAAAAAVWSYDPTLSARDVAGMLIQTASPLQTPDSNLCAQGTDCFHQISLCNAIVHVCSHNPLGNSRCPTPAVSCSASGSQDNINFPQSLRNDISHHFAKALPAIYTGPVMSFHDRFPAPTPQKWVNPQPVDPGCSVCMFSRTSGLFVELDARTKTPPPVMTLTLYFTSGASPTTYSFRTGGLLSTRTLVPTGEGIPTMGTPVRAMLSWPILNGSTAEEIPIVP